MILYSYAQASTLTCASMADPAACRTSPWCRP
jgi:hypothetical protein